MSINDDNSWSWHLLPVVEDDADIFNLVTFLPKMLFLFSQFKLSITENLYLYIPKVFYDPSWRDLHEAIN